MNKKFFFYAFAALTAISFTACSSDSDDTPPAPKPADLPAPPTTAQAATYHLTTPLPSTETASEQKAKHELRQIDITESSRVIIEVYDKDTKKTKYVSESVSTTDGKLFQFPANSTKVRGTIEVVTANARTTRAAGEVTLKVNITFEVPEMKGVEFKAPEVDTQKTDNTVSDQTTVNLVRNWEVTGTILDLSSTDKNVYEEFDSKNGVFDMEDILKECDVQGVNLSASEREEFKRQIKSVEFTGAGKFTINYTNHADDVAVWTWTNSNKNAVKLKFQDAEMGNKFITDDSVLDIIYNGDRCNMKLTTSFNDDSNKKWDVVFTLKLKPAQTN